ncbi:MAG: saccharopine dehydrogenase NADP-binding domain-containing protein [Chitinophagaceae bacterium]|nr:saccharopine dehydrogenase NADP-binding domain-containing protein [Chitinophagaceae bacterium]
MKIAVLGAGMVGSAIALDLAQDYEVSVFDKEEQALQKIKNKNSQIFTCQADLSETKHFEKWFAEYDFAVSAVPGFLGFKTLKALIEAGKNVVDISFFAEDAFALDATAKQKGVSVITDCGVAPGLSNMIAGRYAKEMQIKSFVCYVGGLPKHPSPPFFYKAPFSPVDVIEEYTRPARLKENGKEITKPALSERESVYFEGIGTLDAFNTDGLRSLLHTLKDVPEMKEKTLRWPGHLDVIYALRDAGFFSADPIAIHQQKISPLEVTSRLLLPLWAYEEGEPDFTIMKIILTGAEATVVFHLYDEFDPESGISSMARTTGYTCTATVNLLVQGLFSGKGVFAPEQVAEEKECFDFVLNYLRKRKIIPEILIYEKNEKVKTP